jgi:O-antigen ligase
VRRVSLRGIRESVQFGIVLGVAALAPLPLGSVALFWILLWTCLLATAVLVAPLKPETRQQHAVLAIIVYGSLAFALVAIVQVWPDPAFLRTHPIWKEAAAAGYAVTPRVSVRAAVPDEVTASALLAVLSLVAGFAVGLNGDRTAIFVRWLARAGAIYAAYALASHLISPGTLLWREKTAYLTDVTGTFVNRNTAAAHFGFCTILWAGIFARRATALNLGSLRWAFLVPVSGTASRAVFWSGSGLILCFAALMGTHSRAGLLAALLGLAAAVVCMMWGRWGRATRWRVSLLLLLLPLAILAAALVAPRIGSEGLFDRSRWAAYESSLALIRQYPLLGTGLGSFPDVFPSVRSPDIPTWGIWDKAHSTFLEIAVEMGLPVAIAVLVAALGAWAFLGSAAVRVTGRRKYILASSAGIVVMAISHSFVDFPLQIPGALVVFATLTGCALARGAAPPS